MSLSREFSLDISQSLNNLPWQHKVHGVVWPLRSRTVDLVCEVRKVPFGAVYDRFNGLWVKSLHRNHIGVEKIELKCFILKRLPIHDT